jgi:beta-lactamase regulating signal transducer with metallopeptidase domain
MNLQYSLRLLCICFASLFLVHATLALGVNVAAPGAIRMASRMRPRFASGFLFWLRMLPLALAGFAVGGLCVPSYLRLEPHAGGEQVGWPCLAIALLGAAMCLGSAARVTKAAWNSLQFGRACEDTSCECRMSAESFPITIVRQQAPLLAVAGIVRHKLVVSTSVLQALSAEELDAVFLHERAHRIWRDNFKRLLILAAPRGFVFSRGLESIERQWSKFAEWAADDHASAGDSRRALSLASALVQFARLGSAAPQRAIVSSFVESSDLSERVERLLRVSSSTEKLSSGMRALVACLFLLVACFMAAGMFSHASLSAVHSLLERLIG